MLIKPILEILEIGVKNKEDRLYEVEILSILYFYAFSNILFVVWISIFSFNF